MSEFDHPDFSEREPIREPDLGEKAPSWLKKLIMLLAGKLKKQSSSLPRR